jgi:hypothetical protein
MLDKTPETIKANWPPTSWARLQYHYFISQRSDEYEHMLGAWPKVKIWETGT